jgi:hypothetical protein
MRSFERLFHKFDEIFIEMEEVLDDFCDTISRATCEHRWRPAITGRVSTPARYCSLCRKTEPLSVEMFYAYFGRMPW